MKTKLTDERGAGAVAGPRDAGQSQAGRVAAGAASPFQLHTILAPVDFSRYSAKALDYVRAFASQFNTEVVLVHVIEPTVVPDNFGIVPPTYDEMGGVLAQTAEERLVRLAGDFPDLRIKTVVRVGRAPWEIVRLAKELTADLIIITTHGYTGLKHVLLGSTAELIVRHAPCPVLTVRDPEHDFVASQPAV